MRSIKAGWAVQVIIVFGGIGCSVGRAEEAAERSSELVAFSSLAPDTLRLAQMVCGDVDEAARSDATFQNARVDCRRRVLAIDKLGSESRRLLEMHWSIPEYHDEQRLRSGPTTETVMLGPQGAARGPARPVARFGPPAFLYAVPQIATYTSIHQIDGQWPRGALVAYVVIEGDEVPESYRRLNLRGGVHCVWLAHDPTLDETSGWVGYVARATNDTTCNRQAPLPPALKVSRTGAPNQSLHDYPPVARFGEGTLRQGVGREVQPLLGVKCLAGWCEIGPEGFEPGDSQTLITESAKSVAQAGRRLPSGAPLTVASTQGLWDEQWLAQGEGANITPALRATLQPVTGAGNATSAMFDNRWQPVAVITLNEDPPRDSKYATWGLRKGTNTLELRKRDTGWEGRLAGQQRTWKVVRTPHHDEAVPSTVRFRWTEYDDEIWVPCDQACCMVRGS